MKTTTRLALPLFAAVLFLAAVQPALAQNAPGPEDVMPPPPPPPPPPDAMLPPPLPPPDAAVAPQKDKHHDELGGYASVTYQLSFPFGNTHQYIGDVSWRGLGLDLEWMVHQNIAVGLLFAWNVFYQNTNAVLHYRPGLDISGNQDRSLNVFPLLVDVRYMSGEKGTLRIFPGLGIGGYVITQRLELGLSSVQSTTFNFALAPELGVLIPVDGDVAVQIEARYNVAFASGGLPIQNWLGLNVGIAWGSAL